MTVPISTSEFLYIIEKTFSTIGFLKSKRVSLCHKRKLPSLIKFRENKKEKKKQIIYENVRSVRKVSSF